MSQNGNRISSLDGLRGLAAVIVLVHHASLIAQPWIDPAGWAVLTQSPLKLLLAGSEAVMVFFVLSGLVVALPALHRGFSWARYYPARLIRLYVPVIAALGAAALLVRLIPRDPTTMPDGSWMQDAQATTVSAGDVLSQMTLLRPGYPIDNVLWSLRWELFFSLLLPLYRLGRAAGAPVRRAGGGAGRRRSCSSAARPGTPRSPTCRSSCSAR